MTTEVTVSPTHEAEVAPSSDIEALLPSSLIIPIKSSSDDKLDQFIEIFPEEIPETPSSTLLQVLKDEDADLNVWADAAMHYIQHKQHAQDAAQILEAGCERAETGTKDDRVRIFAAAGIAHLTAAQEYAKGSDTTTGGKRAEHDLREELTSKADNRFTLSSKVDNLYPMTWMGKGMLNLQAGRLEQAKFFFETTLKECGKVLPALLGMAAVMYLEKNYKAARNTYAEAIRLYPNKSGASTRVGFGLASYRLGQVDRAKAAFARALEMDPENVEAMVGAAVLDMMNLDETSSDFNAHMERAIKMMSMANLLDHSNAMVQNHLANHYFWKWTPIAGTVQVTHGSKTVKGSQPIPLDEGDRVRIGTDFESLVTDDGNGDDDSDDDDEVDGTTFQLKDAWKGASATGLKVWKKDYDRVIALAKGAYNSTSVPEIQAESLFLLARVYHVREMMEDAKKVYDRACKLNPNLTPARFGLAQVLIYNEEYAEAAAHLQLVLGTSNTATDAIATLGLLEVKAGGKKTEGGLSNLRKAIDLDPLNPELILLEALALQQQESTYPKALERYKKAVQLLERQGKEITYDIYTNIGVLSHETRSFDDSLSAYKKALDALDEDATKRKASLENVGVEGGRIRHKDNDIFFDFIDSNITIANPRKGEDEEGVTTLSVLNSDGRSEEDLLLQPGDDIRINGAFETEIEAIQKGDGGLVLQIKDPYKGEKTQKEKDESNMEVDGEMKETDDPTEFSVFVKRENNRLKDPVAISIAFNLARLHEAAGRTLAAIELHKAIVKRNPAYVNSYLRLACIAIDCGALNECAGWLKIAAETAPGNPEVLTLIGNLHLSLCDWAPAQQIFDGLLGRKVPNVEAYALLSMGNIYFANLDIPGRYAKHLGYAGDFYKRILQKDNANAYAANGLGSVMAEKAELFKAKEVFNRVRETTGDTIADAHLNLAHIYLAQKKHPEALQMYQSYLKRTEDGTAPITSKSRLDDKVDVLHYIAFAYFDWARQTELFNDAKAAPADERYKMAMQNLELAIIDNTSESKNSILTYNLCMTKLQAANCVLQKLTRNIRRTALEVEEALNGLQQSLETVETIAKNKAEGAKVLISTSILNDFITHCKSNIESAKSHLEDERKREDETREVQELQRTMAEMKRQEQLLEQARRKEEEARKQEERDRKARQKMRKVDDLRSVWEQEQAMAKADKEKRAQKKAPPSDMIVPDDAPIEEEEEVAPSAAALFDDSDDSDEEEESRSKKPAASAEAEEKSSDDEDGKKEAAAETTQQDLFGDSSDESDEELKPSSAAKRGNNEKDDDDNDDVDEPPNKKSKVLEDSD
ncbi:tetratricopeptide repeat protein [Nitzschia inconspicua]|uniref:Tetratricopeptide repeat protein n=1 Tax=Nitzschia inconspicua TaxID=303405 RepID=A0A9K3PRY7_9STRA|nr:tetratricopeptide repeat protein [Nitzschia inconspicua]